MQQNTTSKTLKPWHITLIVIAVLVLIGITVAVVVVFSKSADTGGKREAAPFLKFIKTNVVKFPGGLVIPKSYLVEPGYFEAKIGSTDDDLKVASATDRYKRCSEQFYQTHGTNIYDASLWTIVWVLQSDMSDEYVSAEILPWIKHLETGGETDIIEVPTKGEAADWSYNGTTQTAELFYNFREASQVTQYAYEVEPRFCQLSNGTLGGANWSGADQKIKSSVYAGCIKPSDEPTQCTEVDTLKYTWSDYRPVTGENAWAGLIANCHVLHRFSAGSEVAVLARKMADRVFRTAKALQFIDGGVYYSPQTTNPSPETLGWNDNQFSVENMASLCAGLYMYAKSTNLKESTDPDDVMKFVKKLASFVVKGCTVYTGTYLYVYGEIEHSQNVSPPTIKSGGLVDKLTDGNEVVTFNNEFAIDTFSWTISVFGTQFEQIGGQGTCFKLWQNAKLYGGYKENGQFRGVGYSINIVSNVMSGEWTLGAIGACRVMQDIYKNDDAKLKLLAIDIADMRLGIADLITKLPADSSAVYYARTYYRIPFGWNAERNASLASTAWQYMDVIGFNPFRIDGAFKTAMPDLVLD